MHAKRTNSIISKFYSLRIFFVLVFFFLTHYLSSQITQTIRGTIVDNESKAGLLGATVVILKTNPIIGAVSDFEGNFRIPQVPVGRYDIQVSFLGYQPAIIPEVLVNSGKELVLSIELKELTTHLEEVVVNSYKSKDKPLNTMALISARTFSVEEAQRYAGGLDDPGRLVSAFAGVSDGNIESNGIIVRGNSPTGAIYRIEGVEVMNPNHYAGEDLLGGGFVSIINSHMLSNSDFLTGAFPAEYGNALSAVFDMNLRTGNQEKREHAFQAGVMGIDFASEGPFVKGKKASYLFNYRYSTFGLVQAFLPKGEGLPVYQDLCFKLNFPSNAGTFSLWGASAIDKYNYLKIIDDNYKTGILGLKHKIVLSNNLYINTSLLYNVFLKSNKWDKEIDTRFFPQSRIESVEGRYTFSTFVNKKFGPKHSNKTGLNLINLFYDIDNQLSDNPPDPLISLSKEKGNSNLVQVFSQSKFDISERIILNAGIHFQYFTLNMKQSIEPRLGLRWNYNADNALTIAYGKHGQTQLLNFYFIRSGSKSEGYSTPNKNLDFTKAHHLIVGFDKKINNNVRLKIEPYFQYLSNIPVIQDSSFSVINLEVANEFKETLINKGEGTNIGIDFTLERFLDKGFYYLVTASVFNSTYKGGDGIKRNTRFNKNFMANFLGGKEWTINSKGKRNILGINGRLNMKGGDRTSPINTDESAIREEVNFDENRAFELRKPFTYRFDLGMSYRKNKQNYSSLWSIQVLNLLYAPIMAEYKFNNTTKKVDTVKQRFVLPSISWKIEF